MKKLMITAVAVLAFAASEVNAAPRQAPPRNPTTFNQGRSQFVQPKPVIVFKQYSGYRPYSVYPYGYGRAIIVNPFSLPYGPFLPTNGRYGYPVRPGCHFGW